MSERGLRSSLRAALTGLALSATMLVLLALLAEGVTRLYYHYESRRFIHPYLGETHKPHHRVSDRTPEGRAYEYRLNNYGFRGEDIPDQKRAGTLRVFTLGGSTTACNEYPAELTWSGVLERRLREALGTRDLHVYNAGMAGATSYRSLLVFLNHLTRLSPDLVVLYEAVNDMGASRPSRARFFRDVGNREQFMQRRSYFLLELARRTQHPWLAGLGGLLQDKRRGPPDPSYHDQNYRNIAHLARGYGIPLAFMTQPVMPEVADTRPINAATLTLGDQLGVPVFDLAARFPMDLDHFLPDRVHYTVSGNERIGGQLAAWIVERGLLPAAAERARRVAQER